jgi:hypothetical protein
MVVKAKRKRKAPEIRKRTSPSQRQAWLDEYAEKSQARARLALRVYEAQDGETQEVLDRIRDRLVIGATGLIRLPDGTAHKVELEIVGAHALYVAVEILSDLWLSGIKVANFKVPDMYCAECKEKLTEPKRAVKRRGRK